jgi:pimeloyl-ACP methyl ester carboxylesterase
MQHAHRDGVDLSFRIDGAGPTPVVLVHGFQNASDSWASMVSHLWTDVTALAPDLAGCGHSSRPPSPDRCTIEAYAADVVGLIEHVGWERPVLVGHSLGAGVVLRIALDRPDLARSLVLVSPISTRGLDFVTHAQIDRLAHPTPEDQLALLRAACHRPIPPELFDNLTAIVRAATPEHIEGATYAMRDFVVEDQLAALRVPTLLIAGDRDRHVPLRNHLATAMAIPRCRLQIFYDVGHVPFLEVPEAFAAVVRAFLAPEGARA